jgi:hypothetical protein
VRSTLPILMLTTATLLAIGCTTTVGLSSGDDVRLTQDTAEVASCKAVGGVRVRDDPNGESDIRNQAAALGGNVVLISSWTPALMEGEAYACQ